MQNVNRGGRWYKVDGKKISEAEFLKKQAAAKNRAVKSGGEKKDA